MARRSRGKVRENAFSRPAKAVYALRMPPINENGEDRYYVEEDCHWNFNRRDNDQRPYDDRRQHDPYYDRPAYDDREERYDHRRHRNDNWLPSAPPQPQQQQARIEYDDWRERPPVRMPNGEIGANRRLPSPPRYRYDEPNDAYGYK